MFRCILNLTVFNMALAGGNFWPSSSFHGGVSIYFILGILLVLYENKKT
jgi:hypothetical protein